MHPKLHDLDQLRHMDKLHEEYNMNSNMNAQDEGLDEDLQVANWLWNFWNIRLAMVNHKYTTCQLDDKLVMKPLPQSRISYLACQSLLNHKQQGDLKKYHGHHHASITWHWTYIQR